MKKQNQLFREKSMEKVGSPEALDDYIRVPGPRAWFFLIAMALLFGGFFVWSLFGVLHTTVPAVAVRGDGRMVCYIREGDIAAVQPGMALEVGQQELTLTAIPARPVSCEEIDPYICHVGGFTREDWVYEVKTEGLAQDGGTGDGVYAAQITTEKVSPISFLWN